MTSRKGIMLGAGAALAAALALGMSGCNGEYDPPPPADGPAQPPQMPEEDPGAPGQPGDMPGMGDNGAADDWPAPAPGGDGQ